MMKTLTTLILLGLSPLSEAQSTAIDCVLAHPQSCHDCQGRIAAACSDEKYNGAFEKSLQPLAIVLKISNPRNGSERMVVIDNNRSTLAALESQRSLMEIAKKNKIKLQKDETLSLASIKVAPTVAFYKSTRGTEIATRLKPDSAQRTIASDQNEIQFAGAVRAQKALGKEQK